MRKRSYPRVALKLIYFIALIVLLPWEDFVVAAPALAPVAQPAQATSGDTVLQNNDLIRITVFGEDDLLTETRISKSGAVNFPLLGSLHLSGKTVDQATKEIRDKLDKDYVINPHVTLMVMEYATQWVTVLGEVQKPGTVEIPPEGGLDILGAIALAGGYTKIAAPNRITVRRQVNGQDQLFRVDGKKLANDTSVKVFYVQPGDMITVGQSIF